MKIKSLIKNATQKGVWIPPLASTFIRLQEFYESSNNKQGSTDYKAWKSFSKSLSGITNPPKIPDPSMSFLKAIALPFNYSAGHDDFARLHLAGNKILKAAAVKKGTTGKTIDVQIYSANVCSEKIVQGAIATSINNNDLHEIISQQQSADLFLLKLNAYKKLEAEKSICLAWDILQPALGDIIYSAKTLADVERPTVAGKIKIDDVLIEVPKHSSWPGGHAFGAGALATLIRFTSENIANSTNPANPAKILELAQGAIRIAQNREYAGLHWKEDTESGFKYGVHVMKGILEHVASKDPSGDLMQILRYAYQA